MQVTLESTMSRLRSAFLLLLLVVLLCVPKSGAYVAGVPVYILYVLVIMSAPISFLLFIAPRKHSVRYNISQNLCIWLLAVFPFWLCWTMALAQFGYTSFAELVGQAFVVFVCPIFFTVLCGPVLAEEQDLVGRVVRLGLRFVVIYGLISFVIGAIHGRYPEVAYITQPGGNVPLAVWQRNNLRGSFLKLVSTYTNGNIYGACMLTMLPVYLFFERKALWRILFIAAIVATLSRTAWAGLVFFALLRVAKSKSASKLILSIVGVAAIGVAVISVGQLLGGSSFIFNSDLGGRAKYFDELRQSFSFLPSDGIGKIHEITYLSYFNDFGLIGGLAFVLFLLGPLLVYTIRWSGRRKPPLAVVAAEGLLVYMFCSVSDGAFVYVPTFAIYCFVAALAMWSQQESNFSATYNARSGNAAGWRGHHIEHIAGRPGVTE